MLQYTLRQIEYAIAIQDHGSVAAASAAFGVAQPTLSAALAKLGANIDEVQHQRAFTTLSVERAQIEVVVQTRGAEHVEQILGALRAQHYRVERVA